MSSKFKLATFQKLYFEKRSGPRSVNEQRRINNSLTADLCHLKCSLLNASSITSMLVEVVKKGRKKRFFFMLAVATA